MTDIYFGKVHNVEDKEHLCRAQIIIPGKTDKLEADSLPWYFSWYGLNYLPEKDEVVPVLIFDDNFSTGFYGNRIKLETTENKNLDGDDYKHYLEIFKREVDTHQVQLTYTKSKGIQFINDKANIVTEVEKINLFVEAARVTITEDLIEIGQSGFEYTVLGDKTVKHLHNIIKHQNNVITQMYAGFQKIMSACTNPMTMPIGAALAGHMPTQAQLKAENGRVNSEADTIQSKHVKIGTK